MSIQTENKTQAIVLSPMLVINLFNSALKVKEEATVINIRGTYVATGRKPYGDYYYDELHDEKGTYSIQFKVHALDREFLHDGDIIEVKAFITRKVDEKGSIKLLVNCTEVVGKEKPVYDEAHQAAVEITLRKVSKGYRDVSSLLTQAVQSGVPPKILILMGSNAIIDSDIKHALGESFAFFKPEFQKVNFSNPIEIANMIAGPKSVKGFEVIVISRGGGAGLEVFNSLELCAAALECKPLLVTAIGHKEDITLLAKVADKDLITPTDLGNYFRTIYNNAREQMENSKAVLIDQVAAQLKVNFQKDLDLKDKEIELYKEKAKTGGGVTIGKVILIAAAAAVIGVIIGMLLK